MAHVPTTSVDFAPSWLNFKTNNKKPDKLADNRPLHSKIFSEFRPQTSYKTGPSLVRHHSFEAKSQLHSGLGDSGYKERKSQWSSSVRTAQPLLLSNQATNNEKGTTNHQNLKLKSQKLENGILDCEFPSLSEPKEKPKKFEDQPNNMWRKPLVLKPIDSEANCTISSKTNTKQLQTSSIYKSLVPKANISSNKPYRRAISVPMGSLYNNHETDKQQHKTNIGHHTIDPNTKRQQNFTENILNKLQTAESTSLNGMAVFSKKSKRGKSSYLKDLRSNKVNDITNETTSTDNSSNDLAVEMTQPLNNGVNTSKDLDADWSEIKEKQPITDVTLNFPLSSSLEAEHRFLREMGWTEGSSSGNGGDSEEEDVSPLTDAEIREFFMRNKRRGLLAVPSISKRTSAFRKALDAWSNSGPPVVRRDPQNEVLQEEEEEELQFKACFNEF